MTMDPLQWKNIYTVQTEPTTPSIKKVGRKGVEDLLNCALTFLFFISTKLKEFCVTQNETPKMVKMSASTNNLSHKNAEHILWLLYVLSFSMIN